jgi:hypothetical protein
MLGYVIFPHFLSGELVAGEVFWWVEPEDTGRRSQIATRGGGSGAKLRREELSR